MHAGTAKDYRKLARRRLPRMVFDYIDGGAEDEVTLRGNADRFRDYQLTWSALQDISRISTATTVMGSPSALPLTVALADAKPLDKSARKSVEMSFIMA